MIEQLRKIAEGRGGRCLSVTCKNAHSILWWECKEGHCWQATAIRVKLAANWCPVCAEKTSRKTIEDLQALATERGGSCLSEVYKGALTKHAWVCSKGHKWEAVHNSIRLGSWCPFCAGNAKPSIEEMQTIAEERGGQCLSGAYINSQTKLQWVCSEGHQWEATPNKIKNGRWCPKCYNATRGDFRRLSIDEMVQIASDRGGRCLSEVYVNTRTKLKWECSEGHQWVALPSDVIKGSWCRECLIINRSKLTDSKKRQ